MKNRPLHLLAATVGGLLLAHSALAVNPIIMDAYGADPTARVFEGKVYLYNSHDIPYTPGHGRANWFIMADYHVYSSENLVDWTDHGVILDQTNVPWSTRSSYDMWAPDCVTKNGKYDFYYPYAGRIGVAIADHPYGPFTPEKQPLQGAGGIDPCVLQDDDGSAYLFWAGGGISAAKLKDNMLQLDSQAHQVVALVGGTTEGPFAFKRNGFYYVTIAHSLNGVNGGDEQIEYGMSTNVFGPYVYKGVIMDQSPTGCWTIQNSMVEYKGQWYFFYHDRDLSPSFDKLRSIRIEKMAFNDDGTIQKVIRTMRGVGVYDAKHLIPVARYSAASAEGATNSYLEPTNTFLGWKLNLTAKNAWVQFNDVDFGPSLLKAVSVRAVAPEGGTLEIRVDKTDGPVLAQIKIDKGGDWKIVKANLSNAPAGLHNLIVTQGDEGKVDVNYVSFE